MFKSWNYYFDVKYTICEFHLDEYKNYFLKAFLKKSLKYIIECICLYIKIKLSFDIIYEDYNIEWFSK